MGLLKKVFKPVAKVLDKIVPNEIKPFLPYAAAFAPVFGPTAGIFGNTMMKRALLSGGANILGQLSQEGSEGDINLLSAGLGALTGAMTAPDAASKFQAMKTPTGNFKDVMTDTVIKRPELSFLDQAKNVGLESLAKGSELLRPGGEIPNLFSKAGLKAATLPAATATGDVMQAEARRLEKQAAIDAALAEAEALGADADRAAAIRLAMQAYGFFTDEEIEDTIASAGYKAGGRVGFNVGGPTAPRGLSALLGSEMLAREDMEDAEDKPFKFDAQQFMIDQYNEEGIQPEIIGEGFDGQSFIIRTPNGGSMMISLEDFTANFGEPPMKAKGIERGADDQPYRYKTGGRVGYRFGGIDAAIDKVEDESIKESAKMVADMPDMDLMDLIEEFEIIFKRKPMNMEELKQFYRENYEMESPVRMKEKIKEKITVKAKDGGRINLREGGVLSQILPQPGFAMQLPTLGAFQPLRRAEAVFPRLNELEQGVNIAENKLSNIRDRLGNEQRGTLMAAARPLGLQQPINMSSLLRSPISALQQAEGMKDGGLMDLGGKEMDLRGGGFVPIGKKERADDVPARLSKNEFVMTADAVRAAGGGSVNKGAKRMYELMNNLEARV